MAYVLDGFAMGAANVVVAPHRPELGTEPAEFIDERLHLRRGAGAGRVDPERAQREPRHAFPIVLRGAGARVEEDVAQDIALARRQRSIIDQHHGRRPVPGHDVPNRGPDHGGGRVERVEHALQPWRDAVVLPVARFGRAAESKQEEMLALDIGQHERARDPIEHVGRGRPAAPLFEPCVPGRADIGPLRHFLAAQAEGAAALRGKAESARVELGAPVPQIAAEQVLGGEVLAHPVSHYTMMKSLLYHHRR